MNHVWLEKGVPNWEIYDTTKVKAYLTCPRKFFYEFILGWRQDQPSHDLHYGIAIHEFFEYVYGKWKTQGPGYNQRDILEGLSVFLKKYREKFPPDTDLSVGAKNPENTVRAMVSYAEHYADDKFKVIYTEISGSAEIRDGRPFHFRLDTLCEDEHGRHFILEHKTSGWSKNMWMLSWSFATQIGIGCHILNCLYEDNAGMVINGVFLRPPMRYNKDGSLAKNSGPGNEFVRIPKRLNADKLEDWAAHVNRVIDAIEYDMLLLSRAKEESSNLEAFPRNETGCFAYNKVCPFHDYCSAWPNPLKRCHQPPVGMRVEHWDPRSQDNNQSCNEGRFSL